MEKSYWYCNDKELQTQESLLPLQVDLILWTTRPPTSNDFAWKQNASQAFSLCSMQPQDSFDRMLMFAISNQVGAMWLWMCSWAPWKWGGGRPYPQCATRDAWSLHAPAGDDNEVHFVVHMDVLDVEACSGKVVVPAYKNRTTHGYLIIIVSHVTKFHGFWTRFKLEIILFWSSALFLLLVRVYLAYSWEMAEDLCGWGRRALWRQQRCYTDACTGELGF